MYKREKTKNRTNEKISNEDIKLQWKLQEVIPIQYTGQLRELQKLSQELHNSRLEYFQKMSRELHISRLKSFQKISQELNNSRLRTFQKFSLELNKNYLSGIYKMMSSVDLTQLSALQSFSQEMKKFQLDLLKSRRLQGIKSISQSQLHSYLVDLDFERISSLGTIFASNQEKLSQIDLQMFELTYEDVEKAHKIIKNDNIEEEVSTELSENKDPKNISKKVKSVFYFIFFILIPLIFDYIQISEYVETKLKPSTSLYLDYQDQGLFSSEKSSVKWLNEELKKDVSEQITKNFRIVIKDNLVVYEQKTKNSRINGRLKTGNVVQIIEKRKNWSYIIYSNFEEEQYFEGWVFTRYLKKIK